ncbi:MAG: ATP-binding protein [Clostridiales Family XIII bacterium]|nr:ATP-binding protein [Clostridiales Family XIII bacterium]
MKTQNIKINNPFNPQFGRTPDVFLGRDNVVNEFVSGLDDINSMNRATIIAGVRGSGKTAILSDVKSLIVDKNRIVIDTTIFDGFLTDIIDQAIKQSAKNILKKIPYLTSLSALSFGVGITPQNATHIPGFKSIITDIAEENKNKQIVFILDEVHNKSHEMREFIATYQHLVRDGFDVAILMAGTPDSVFDILNDKVLTFFRSAYRVYLKNIDIRLVAYDYNVIFQNEVLAHEAAEASYGYPYLIQLVGYYLYKDRHRDLQRTILQSKIELFRNVHELIFYGLSDGDKRFLNAMNNGENIVSFSDIVVKMGVAKNYASSYRRRLLDSGLIEEVGYGKLRFALPYMGEFLLEISRMI